MKIYLQAFLWTHAHAVTVSMFCLLKTSKHFIRSNDYFLQTPGKRSQALCLLSDLIYLSEISRSNFKIHLPVQPLSSLAAPGAMASLTGRWAPMLWFCHCTQHMAATLPVLLMAQIQAVSYFSPPTSSMKAKGSTFLPKEDLKTVLRSLWMKVILLCSETDALGERGTAQTASLLLGFSKLSGFILKATCILIVL